MARRGDAASPEARAALDAGRAKRHKIAKEAGFPKAKERWAALLSGQLLVTDLDDQEITNMRVRGKDGGFSGQARKLPSHLAKQFRDEAMRRAVEKFRTAAPEAIQALINIGNDPDEKTADRIKALSLVVDRALGRTPETIHLVAETPFDAVSGEAVGISRDMADEAEAFLAEQGHGKDGA